MTRKPLSSRVRDEQRAFKSWQEQLFYFRHRVPMDIGIKRSEVKTDHLRQCNGNIRN